MLRNWSRLLLLFCCLMVLITGCQASSIQEVTCSSVACKPKPVSTVPSHPRLRAISQRRSGQESSPKPSLILPTQVRRSVPQGVAVAVNDRPVIRPVAEPTQEVRPVSHHSVQAVSPLSTYHVRLPSTQAMPTSQLLRRSPSLCSRAVDYRWLIGYLQYDILRDRWYVRYCEKHQFDRLGGCVELLQTGLMTGFQAGQLVRVEGGLVDPAPYEIVPGYRVQSLQVLLHAPAHGADANSPEPPTIVLTSGNHET
jgi:hypothetical protein